MIVTRSPLGAWPALPTGPKLSVRDVGLLDLARHAAMRAALPLGTIAADTNELWDLLKDRADALDPDLDRDAIVEALEHGAHQWAKVRVVEHGLAPTQET